MWCIGIDPGLQATGFAVLRAEGSKMVYLEAGTWKTKAADSLEVRLASLTQSCLDLLACYPNSLVAMEEGYMNRNPRSSLMLGHARGALVAAVGMQGLPLRTLTPTAIKKALTGYGQADKQALVHMLGLLIADLPGGLSLHAYDALAMAWMLGH